MSKILVSGLINIETNVIVDSFPIQYSPVLFPFFKVGNNPSGVGLNIANALSHLGNEVNLASLLSDDFSGRVIRASLDEKGISHVHIPNLLKETPLTVVIADQTGKRQIHCDLKDVQEVDYPKEEMTDLIEKADILILTPLNLNRPFLSLGRQMGKIIATDLHVLHDIHDPYQQDFLQNADILFFSNEGCIGNEAAFIESILPHSPAKLIVCGMGSQGSLLYQRDRNEWYHQVAITVRPIQNTIGAGDALFSCFIHYYLKGFDPKGALKMATYYAGYKIGENGASLGLLDEVSLEALIKSM